jgi:hypothetical protein
MLADFDTNILLERFPRLRRASDGSSAHHPVFDSRPECKLSPDV